MAAPPASRARVLAFGCGPRQALDPASTSFPSGATPLRYPNFTPNPDLLTDRVHTCRPGEPVETARAPLAIGPDGDVFCLPGPVGADTMSMLPHAVNVVHRITPFATIIAAPILVSERTPDGYPHSYLLTRKDKDSNPYVEIGGLSFNREDLIAISLRHSGSRLIDVAYHEAWHQVEKILSKKTIDEVDAHLIPLDFGSAYLSSMVERRARAFAAWCMRFEEGLPTLRLATAVDRIFDEVASGEVARRWIKEQERAAKRAARSRR